MKKRLLTALLCIMTFIIHSQTVISAAAAANLFVPMKELETAFYERNPEIKLNITFGASGKLAAQIIEGGEFDIFLAADTTFPERIFKHGLALSEPVLYASGKLVLFTTTKNSIKNGINTLKERKIRSISAANPETAPYGRAAIAVLKNAGLYENIKNKIVYAESISQVTQQVQTASDAGFIAKSSLYAKGMERYNIEKEYWIDIDPTLYTPIDQAMILLKNGNFPKEAMIFYNFLLSEEAAAIFRKYGYDVNK